VSSASRLSQQTSQNGYGTEKSKVIGKTSIFGRKTMIFLFSGLHRNAGEQN
jgi:hypothetical protein